MYRGLQRQLRSKTRNKVFRKTVVDTRLRRPRLLCESDDIVVNAALLLTSVENNCSARTNTDYFDAGGLSFLWVLTNFKKCWLVFHLISLLLCQCQRSKTQQTADRSSMFYALDLICRFTEYFCSCEWSGVWRTMLQISNIETQTSVWSLGKASVVCCYFKYLNAIYLSLNNV